MANCIDLMVDAFTEWAALNFHHAAKRLAFPPIP